jgi:nucleoside-diphosphate-sugar epimerase
MNNLANNGAKTPRSKILILGATGGTGRLIVDQALERGQEVTALVRSPEKASWLKGAKLIVGDVRDEKCCGKPSKVRTRSSARWVHRRASSVK